MHWTNSKRLLVGLAVATALGTSTALPAMAATLRMAWSQDATGLDPHKQTAFSSLRLMQLIYEPLVRLDPQYNVVPAIAKSWAFSADGLTLTFKLDPNAKFSTGDAVTSNDVKASFTRILDQATAAAARANFTSIKSIDTPDPQTVVFNLSQPDAPILVAMSTANASIVQASAITDGSIGTKAIGSGPFKLDEWDPNSKEVLSANPNWAGGKTGVDGITISVLPSESAIVDAMRANQVDFALLNDPTVATLVPNEQNMTLSRIPGLDYNVLQLNPSRPPMDNEKVRQAISCAVDRQAIIDTALVGRRQGDWSAHPGGLCRRSRDAVLLQAGRRQSQAADEGRRPGGRLLGDRHRRHRRAALRRQRSAGAAEPARRDQHQAHHPDDGSEALCRSLAQGQFRHGGGAERRPSRSLPDV